MNNLIDEIVKEYLQPTPTPQGLTSRELVRKAIEFDCPPRIPYSFYIPFKSDFFESVVVSSLIKSAQTDQNLKLGDKYYDEWGVGQQVTEKDWDHAFDHPLKDLSKLDSYKFPNLSAEERFLPHKPYLQQAKVAGKYIVAPDTVELFERMRSLMGFEELMIAPYTQPEGLEALLNRLTDMTIAVIRQWARMGDIDGFMIWQDWGLQTALQMNVKTFRQFYKSRYQRIVQEAHDNGMSFIWHNCGQILDMIPDMIDIGVDVIQLDQPRLMGYRELVDRFGGQICFWNTVDIQWSVQDQLSAKELQKEVSEMTGIFNRTDGGFIARHYPQGNDIGLSAERHHIIYQAFLENGCK